MSGEQLPGCMGRGLGGGAWWLPNGGISASQGFFSSWGKKVYEHCL